MTPTRLASPNGQSHRSIAPVPPRPAHRRSVPNRMPVRSAWKRLPGKHLRFVFTPEDTTAAWDRDERVQPNRIASTRMESLKALFWIAVSVTLSLAIAAL